MSDTEKPTEGTNPNSHSENTAEQSDQILIGPGRMPGAKNALVHGLYAADIILPWESEKDFESLFWELKSEWLPRGRQEMETVLSLARLNFLKHRLMRSTQIAFRRDPFLAKLKEAGAKTWAEVSALMEQRSQTDDDVTAVLKDVGGQLKRTLSDISSQMTAQNRDIQEVWRKVELVDDLYGRMRDHYNTFVKKDPSTKNVKIMEPSSFISNPKDLLEQAYHPDYLEKLVRLEASIDARIDKLIHRLMTLQEFKRIRSQNSVKTISASPSSQNEN